MNPPIASFFECNLTSKNGPQEVLGQLQCISFNSSRSPLLQDFDRFLLHSVCHDVRTITDYLLSPHMIKTNGFLPFGNVSERLT